MRSPRQPSWCRRRLVAAFVAAALPLLSGCASGFDSPVLQDYNPAVGVNVRKGDVWAMNMLVVMSDSGQGTLVGALLNKGPRTDRLVNATLQSEPNEQPLTSSMLRSTVPLTPGRLVELSEPPTVAAEGTATPGSFVIMTLQFQRAEPVQVQIPVVAPEGPYEHVQLPGSESPSPSPTEQATPQSGEEHASRPARGASAHGASAHGVSAHGGGHG